MIGKYTFRQNGEVIGESTNLITTAGKNALLRYVAGFTKKFVASIGVGIGTQSAVVSDRMLNFEVYRYDVTTATIDYANNAVVFITQLPAGDEVKIYEAGAFALDAQTYANAGSLIFNFDEVNDSWSSGTWVSTNSRLGSALRVSAAVSASTTSALTGLSIDLSGYSTEDQFAFAYYPSSNVASVQFRLMTDASNYYSYTVSTPTANTYAISKVNKGLLTKTGSPDWANITQVQAILTSTAGGASTVDLDGIRIDNTDNTREDDVLISRTVLGTQVTKTVGSPLDIEYRITF